MTNLMDLDEVEEVKFNEAWVPWHLRAKEDNDAYRTKLESYRDKIRSKISAS